MKLTVIGSADAFNSAGRRHSCYLIESPRGGKLMIDFGATALLGLRALGVEPNELSAIAFTHLHGDHIGGYPFLIIDALYNNRRTHPLRLLGPIGTRQALSTLLQATYAGVEKDLNRLELPIEELAPGSRTSVAGYEVCAFEADHMDPPEQPLCLRVTDDAGRVIAFSGDTRLCPDLFAAAEGADLCVAECTALEPPAGRHSTFAEWREAFTDFRGRALAFTHLGADVRAALPSLLQGVDTPFPIRVLDDGDRLEIGAADAQGLGKPS